LSRLDPLIDALKKTESDELRIVVGERIFAMRGGRRQDLGREPVQPPSVQALAAEVLKADEILAVRKAPRTVRVERGGEPIELTFTVENGNLSITMRRSSAVAVVEEDRGAFASVPAMAAPAAPPPKRTSAKGGHAIDEILHEMIGKRASDLHLSSGSCPVLRIDGEVHFLRERPVLSSEGIYDLLAPLFTEKAKKDFEEKNDADCAYEVPGLARFRVNAFRDRHGVGAVMRQIPIEIIPAEKLGLPQAVLDLCWLSKGLVVVTGPTGSGKSTTLAGMVDFINKNRSDHIITIEDPVEFVHKNIKCLVNQREVGLHTQSFKNALRAALREDPDIVLVGEMRDLETIAIAIETAETGHLVFGTLHTTTAISTVDRIIDQFPTDQQEQIRVMLSESLKGVVAQVLCKKIGGGRVAAMEILLGSSAVSSLIR
jgi:twitching motility protein PilT